MMFNTKSSLVAGLTALFLSLPLVAGQNVSTQYTVYASVVYARTGEHTPALNLVNEIVKLTPFGAKQMANLVRLNSIPFNNC
jgi:hypothetical protein